MAVIAVAGGTGKLGRAIVDVLISISTHEVLVLARETNGAENNEIGAPVLAVNYSNPDEIATVLETNNVDTVISTLNSMAGHEPELNLIQAAEKSAMTKRYIPSIWGIKFTPQIAQVLPIAKLKIELLQALEATSLEYTAVLHGYFLDYYVAPTVKSYMQPLYMAIDIPNNTAAIPGSGDVPVVFTHSSDVARFVAAALTLPKWEKESYIIGDKVTWNQFLKIAEAAKGVKFDVVYDSVDALKAGKITELPSHSAMYPFFPKESLQASIVTFGIMFERGLFDLKPSQTLNDAFPHIKPRTIKELMEQAWKGK